LPPKHILVPFDGSPQSTKAFHSALSIAKKHESKISLLTVSATEKKFSIPFKTVNFAKYASHLYELGEIIPVLVEFEKIAKKNQVEISGEIVHDIAVSRGIIQYAKNHSVDLIIIGNRGLKGWKKELSDSVSDEVAKHAPCDVQRI